MKINILKILIFSIVSFLLVVFFIGLSKNSNYNTKNLVGNKISNFELISIFEDEKKINQENLKTKEYSLINFFASWCLPCRIEHKYLLKLSRESEKIKIIGINFKDKKTNAINFLEELSNPYNFVGKDSKGKISILFGIYGIPETILVDNNLTIIKKIVGPIDQIQYDEILKLIQ